MFPFKWLLALIPSGLLILIGLLRGFYAHRSYADRKRPSRLLTLTTPRPWQEVRDRLRTMRPEGRYRLDEDKPDQRLLTLSTRPTNFSWGFFLPIYGESGEGGSTQLTIGIESKFIQYGPIVTHHHQKCLSAVKEALARELTPSRMG